MLAYLDPGTGSLLFYLGVLVTVGVVVGVVGGVSRWWWRRRSRQ